MGVSKKDVANVAKLSGLILGSIFTGGTGAAVAAVAGGVGTLLGGGDDQKEHEWKVKQIPAWMTLCRELMDIPMANERKRETLINRIDADWFKHYGRRAKRRDLEKLHSDILFAVTAEIASTIPDGD